LTIRNISSLITTHFFFCGKLPSDPQISLVITIVMVTTDQGWSTNGSSIPN
jgi:hypothetical protein